MTKIITTGFIRQDFNEIAAELRDEIDSPAAEWTAWEYALMRADGFVDGNRCLQIVHHADARRGGIVLVGSGSSGVTSWTDAATPDEVLARYLADDMRN